MSLLILALVFFVFKESSVGPAYLGVEVGHDGEATGEEAEEDGQHPGPGPDPLLLVPAHTQESHQLRDC